MIIYLAADHAGYELKEKIKKFLTDSGYTIQDFGAHKLDPDDDYPDFIHQAAKAVSKDPENSRAIILGASGQGEAMIANRYKGVRAAVYYGGEKEILRLSREHNDANVLALGARFLNPKETLEAVAFWLKHPFSRKERHLRRIIKIDL